MQFSVRKRDGPARIGELVIDNKKIITPNILFISTPRFKAPSFANMIITNNGTVIEKPALNMVNSSFLTGENVGEFQIPNRLIFPKDMPQEFHLSAINSYVKREATCYVLPANRGVINNALEDNHASFFIVGNTVQLFRQQSKFTDFIIELREKIGYQKTIYLPCVGRPTSFALLTYMGVDFFDSTSAILAARKKILLFPTGEYSIDTLKELSCSCPVCNGFKGKPSEMNFQQILDHNYFALFNEIKQVRNAIHNGMLHELIETRIRANPTLTAIFRYLNRNHYRFLEERTPVIRKGQLIATTKEALYRPEIKRFQERIIERYKKPESARVLLLLPCSAKKPYSFSKSHMRFKEELNNLRNPHVVHEVIITSPLGIVPREMELTYPSSAYDIPVTGFWDEDEKKMIRDLLKRYLEINRYEKIILHLPKVVRRITEGVIKESIDTEVEDNPISSESLRRLSDILKEATGSYEKIEPSTGRRESIESLAAYQFGRKIAQELLAGSKIKGKYPYQKIMRNNTQLGMITKERGLISLTLNGARAVAKSGKYYVVIHNDFMLEGSVLAPGVKDADESIRIGDEVVMLKGGKLCAAGVAQMNGKEMKESTYGEAVKIRHKI